METDIWKSDGFEAQSDGHNGHNNNGGLNNNDDDDERDWASVLNDPLIREAIMKGEDLRDYTKKIEQDLADVEKRSIRDYISQDSKLKNLNAEIQECDFILSNMETLLGGFQRDLAGISEEIQNLQDQSVSMNVRLKNLKSAEGELTTFLDLAVIQDDLKRNIFEAEVNEGYVQYLQELRKKIAFVRDLGSNSLPALRQIQPDVERLREKAASRVRDSLLEKIKIMNTKKKTNVTVHQQTLLKLKQLNHFLIECYPTAALEIQKNYVNIMEDYYYKNFQVYTSALLKLSLAVGDKNDFVGSSEKGRKGTLNIFPTGKQGPKERINCFSLGSRTEVLDSIDADVIVPHVAEEKHKRLYFEGIFRSVNRMLMDNACSEYLYLTEFFNMRAEATANLFEAIFARTIDYVMNVFRSQCEESYDAIGLLICLRINYKHRYIMQHRLVPCLDRYLNQIDLVIWPRFQQVMDKHIQSLKSADVDSFGPIEIHAHLVVRKYAELVTALCALNEGFNDTPVNGSLKRLREQAEHFILRYAQKISPRRSQLMFFVNQYDVVMSTLNEIKFDSLDGEKAHWSKLLGDRSVEFAEQELVPFIGKIIAFVKNNENSAEVKQIPPDQFEVVSSEFNANWRSALTKINQNVLTSFSNYKTGGFIQQSIFKQLVIIYSQFILLLEKRFGRNARLPFREEPVSLEVVKMEAKNLAKPMT